MAIAFESLSSLDSGAAGTSTTLDWTAGGSTPSGQTLIAILGFEGVAAGSGPYVSSVSQAGWNYLATQPPPATGNGLEVWYTNGWSSGNTTTFNFGVAETWVARGLIYNGQFRGIGAAIRTFTAQQWTGNNPQAPSITPFTGEMVIAVASDQLAGVGYGAPTSPAGYTLRIDNARAGVFGNVEITAADHLATVGTPTGAITWTTNTATGTTKGATMTFVLRAPATPSPGFRAYLV